MKMQWQQYKFVCFRTRPLARAVLLTLLTAVVHAQEPGGQLAQITDAMSRLLASEANVVDVEVLAEGKATQAIPGLEGQFHKTSDLQLKTKVAAALVRLGETSPEYWDFVLQRATLVIESGIPNIIFTDAQGVSVTDRWPPELIAWAQQHNTDINTAGLYAMKQYPAIILMLGETEDRRAVPLLRKALLVRNSLIVSMAARGLAQVKNNDSVPFIIAAIDKASQLYKPVIAESLIFFDDPRAQSAVSTYVSPDVATMIRQKRASGEGPYGTPTLNPTQ